MKCQRCPNPATLHITEIVKGEVQEFHFCEDCAQNHLTQAEEGLPENEESLQAELDDVDQLACPHCGITFKEFRKQGRLGCPRDYVVFEKELLPLLENIHGETQHCGKVPKRMPDDSLKQYRLIKLRNDLKVAIAEESYEDAARLRDEIQALEQGQDSSSSQPE